MANFKSDLIAAKDATSVSEKQVDGDRTGGLLLLATCIVTLKTAMAANDTIQLFDLPAGAVIVPQLSHVTGLDPGTTLTVDIGDAADPDRYADGIVLSAGGQVDFTSATMPAAVAVPYRPSAMVRIYATIASAAAITDNVVAVFTIAFRCKG